MFHSFVLIDHVNPFLLIFPIQIYRIRFMLNYVDSWCCCTIFLFRFSFFWKTIQMQTQRKKKHYVNVKIIAQINWIENKNTKGCYRTDSTDFFLLTFLGVFCLLLLWLELTKKIKIINVQEIFRLEKCIASHHRNCFSWFHWYSHYRSRLASIFFFNLFWIQWSKVVIAFHAFFYIVFPLQWQYI